MEGRARLCWNQKPVKNKLEVPPAVHARELQALPAVHLLLICTFRQTTERVFATLLPAIGSFSSCSLLGPSGLRIHALPLMGAGGGTCAILRRAGLRPSLAFLVTSSACLLEATIAPTGTTGTLGGAATMIARHAAKFSACQLFLSNKLCTSDDHEGIMQELALWSRTQTSQLFPLYLV